MPNNPTHSALRIPYLPHTKIEDLSEAVDDAWARREEANTELLYSLATLLLHQVRGAYPDATMVIIREDRSHLPAHGHIDDILGEGGNSLLDAGEGSHAWSESLDDLAWEIYQVAPSSFAMQEDGRRRLSIALFPEK